VKDENTLKEIEELRIRKGQELKTMKEDFESGKITGAEGVQKQADDFQGLDRQTLSSFKDKVRFFPHKFSVFQISIKNCFSSRISTPLLTRT
jgi:hypothetical protein